LGAIVQAWLLRLPDHYPHVRRDAFVVMPDHVRHHAAEAACRHGKPWRWICKRKTPGFVLNVGRPVSC